MIERTIQTPNGPRKAVNLADYFVGVRVLEAELNGRVYIEMSNGRFWQVRRNGATQKWKRDPNRFRIPLKYGLRGYTSIDNNSLADFWLAID